METANELKERLYPLLENLQNVELLKKVEDLIYTESKFEEGLTETEILLFEKRRQTYLDGEGKNFSWEEVKELARVSKK